MSDKEAVRLVHHIILQHFGPLVAQAAHPLLHRGRLTLPALCSLAKLAPKPTRAALIVLSQHNLLFWTGPSAEGPEAYEANVKGIMELTRVGRVVEIGRELYGPEAAEILYLLITRGKLQVPDILAELAAKPPSSDAPSPEPSPVKASKSDSKGKGKRRGVILDDDDLSAPSTGPKLDRAKSESIKSTLLSLLQSTHLLPFHHSQLVSPRDKLISFRREELAKLKGVVAQKDRNKAYERASDRIREEREEWSDVSRAIVKKNSVATSKSKRSKVDAEVESVDEDIYLQVNFDKFNLRIRNDLIIQAASDRFNAEAGHVLSAMLKSKTSSQHRVAEIKSDPTTIHEIVKSLPSKLDLSRGIFDPSSSSSDPSSSSSSSSSNRATLIQTYLSLLAAEENPTASGALSAFVSKAKSGRDSSGTYVVEFETVARRLKARVLDAVVRERWGDDAARVLNVVLKHGKMDEKHIAKIAMLSPQSIRQITATLSSSSLLELQEVPKSADRQPSRTFYLWHVDLARAYTALISHLYKTLANLLQRKQKEVDERRMLVEKRNRSDVVESGGELMGREEKEELERMEEVVRRLTLAEQRTDLNIFVLRDLPGGPVGMMSFDDL